MCNYNKAQGTKQKAIKLYGYKLKECCVVLYDIAFYSELIPLRYKQLFQQQLKQITKLFCINISKHPDYIQLLKQNMQKANAQNNRFIQKNSLRDIFIKKNKQEYKTIEPRLSSKNIESTKNSKIEVPENSQSDDEIYPWKFEKYRCRTLIDNIDESSSDQTSNEIESHIPKKVIRTNTKVLEYVSKLNINRENILRTSSQDTLSSNTLDLTHETVTSVESVKMIFDGTNCSDKTNLIFTNCKIKKDSSEEESFTSVKCYHNLSLLDSVNRTNQRVKQDCSQSMKSVKNDFSTNKSNKKIKTEEIPKGQARPKITQNLLLLGGKGIKEIQEEDNDTNGNPKQLRKKNTKKTETTKASNIWENILQLLHHVFIEITRI